MVVGNGLGRRGSADLLRDGPGNTADVKTHIQVVKRMRERLRLREITVVADRGMVFVDQYPIGRICAQKATKETFRK
jgi:hypothetical protein